MKPKNPREDPVTKTTDDTGLKSEGCALTHETWPDASRSAWIIGDRVTIRDPSLQSLFTRTGTIVGFYWEGDEKQYIVSFECTCGCGFLSSQVVKRDQFVSAED